MPSPLLAALMTFLFAAAASPVLIRTLRALKLTQPIRAELPPDHQAKRGTPLMAGLILLAGAAAPLLLHPGRTTAFLAAVFFSFSAIGFLDDWKKAYEQNPAGMSGAWKLLLQFAVTGGLIAWSASAFPFAAALVFGSAVLPLHAAIFVLLAALFVVSSANAINFTDGMDGLLIVVAIPSYFFFVAVSDDPDVRLFALTMIACLLGLLLYNAYPAKAFMGDTGSLAIGGSLAFLAVREHVLTLAPLLFCICFAEQLSVVLQVWYYKRTRLRLFRMSPVHYHFRLKYGWSEQKIVTVFGLASWACALLCIAICKLGWAAP